MVLRITSRRYSFMRGCCSSLVAHRPSHWNILAKRDRAARQHSHRQSATHAPRLTLSSSANRPEAVSPSEEFQHLCDYQLRLLSEVLSSRGQLVASVYIRVPASLQSGDLELQRVCWTQPEDTGVSKLQRSILIGGAGSKLTEEAFISQPIMSLPGRGHVVVPLASGTFLVGLLVLEGFITGSMLEHATWSQATPSEAALHVMGTAASAQAPLHSEAHAVATRTASPSASNFASRAAFEPATHILKDNDTERLLLLTGGVLTGASAMELRAVLLAAAQAQTWRSAQLTLQELAQSTAALRTMGHMLLPRLETSSVEGSMAAAMLEQGSSVAHLTQELEVALQPLSGDHVSGEGACRVLPSARSRSEHTTTPSHSVLPTAASSSAWDGSCDASRAAGDELQAQSLRSCDVMESSALREMPAAIPAESHRGRAGSDELRFAECSECSADGGQHGADDAADWLVLRSIDDSEAAMLMTEGDALCFGESDAWRRKQEAAELLPRPAWHPSVTVVDPPQPSVGVLMATVGTDRQLCSALDIVAQAVAPVKKLCDVVGVELVLMSSSLLLAVNHLMGRGAGVAGAVDGASDRMAQQDTLISVANADSAGRAISHVLDASMQRVGKRGRLLVDIDGGNAAKVQVVIADTGTEMLPELRGCGAFRGDAGGGSTATRQTAQHAIERMRVGLPVGSGEMGIQIAERLLRENGGSLAVGSWMRDEEEYVRTTVTFQAGAELFQAEQAVRGQEYHVLGQQVHG